MPKIVQHRRGDTTGLASITGAAGEIFVDTSVGTLIVHDGVTTGGSVLARTTDLNTLSSNTWRSATSSVQGLVRPDGTSILVTSGVLSLGSGFPTGGIIMWSGTIATIPSGWYLCDGNNGTPDLRNKFIIAADADDGGAAKTSVTGSATQTGGSKDLIVPAHTHTSNYSDNTNYLKNVQMSTATGAGSGTNPISIPEDGTYSDYIESGRNDGGNRWLRFKNSGTTLTTRTLTTDSTGSSATNANLPPYYALAFIMKG